MEMVTIAASVFSFVTSGVVAFQFALALGIPWGSYAMGGKFPGRFPPVMRIAAIFQAVLLGFMVAIVLSRAGLFLPRWSQASAFLVWAVVAFGIISVVLNTITPSAGERRIWLPVAIVMLACSLTIAIAGG